MKKLLVLFSTFLLIIHVQETCAQVDNIKLSVYRLVQVKSVKTNNQWIPNPWIGEKEQYKVVSSFIDDSDQLFFYNLWIERSDPTRNMLHFVSSRDSISIDRSDRGGIWIEELSNHTLQIQWYSTYKNHKWFPENDWVTEKFERVDMCHLYAEEQILEWVMFFPSGRAEIDTLGLRDVWLRKGFVLQGTEIVPDTRPQNYYKKFGKDYAMTALTPKIDCVDCEPGVTIQGWYWPIEYLGEDVTRESYLNPPVIHKWIDRDTIHSLWFDYCWDKDGRTIREVWERVK